MPSAPLAASLATLALAPLDWLGFRRKPRASDPAAGAVSMPGLARDELLRRLDELAAGQEALAARLARLEALAQAGANGSHPTGPRLGRRVDPGAPATSGGPLLISVPDLATPPAAAPALEAAAVLDRRFGPVWAMADEGTPVEAIARETGYPIGQVELILGLRRRLIAAGVGADA